MVTAAAPGSNAIIPRTVDAQSVEPSRRFEAMGGVVGLRVACHAEEARDAERTLRLVEGRIRAWARRLTRFGERSDLIELNRSGGASVRVPPTLGTVLERARVSTLRTEGIVDVTLLDARTAAEAGHHHQHVTRSWSVSRDGRGYAVTREPRLAFDLDGVAKGWIADRALGLLDRYQAAMVDADGDVALCLPAGSDWQIAIADPRDRALDLAVIGLPASWPGGALGVGTSGTTVHRWEIGSGWAHHLIDPRTGRPATTDVVQATVLAESALVAESLAKAAVIDGSEAGLRLLERAAAWAAVLVLEGGEAIASASSSQWLV